ncbi:MAG TPA: hypothetical protein VFL55_16505 [Acetobacteraceae bacterium]|nr:hypothetical protein [Acetobacteraceae bacterium]
MSEGASSKASLRERTVEEFKAFAALAIYLYICLGAVMLFKSAVLQGVGVSFTIWGIAAIKAMLLAKFMLIGRMLHLGERYRDKPLIWPTLHHAVMSLAVLLILTTVEELVVGLIHSRAVGDSLNHVIGPIFFQGIAVCIIMFLILVPYSAFTCLGRVLGERELFRLFFIDRTLDQVARSRLTGMPEAQRHG